MNPIKIIIVDDHSIFRQGLKLLLEKIKGIKVIAEASNGKEFLDQLENQNIDIAFMDINMPLLDGVDATSLAAQKYPSLKIIALSAFGDDESLNKMLIAGVDGFMVKNSEIAEFEDAINKVISGGNYFSDEILIKLTRNVIHHKEKKIEMDEVPQLSEREMEVLQLICKGYSNKKIGSTLNISDRTVERHKTNLIEKTQSENTLNLVIFAFKHKLVDF
jgi:DNA-binding NarL/FixJ family response regulator